MNSQVTDIITHYEAEHFVENLQIIQIKEYGSKLWFKQDENLQKLNMQAHVNALMRSDEFIMEACVTFDKIKLLIYDLIMSEMWKLYVFPKLKIHLSEFSTLKSYILVQHEAIICNLLQIMFFHRTAVEQAENYLLEVIDYCYRNLSALISNLPPKKLIKHDVQYYINRSKLEEFEEQEKSVKFQIQMMCLSIIRYISDYLKYLPINIVHHLIVENDIFFILVPLIEEKPWLRTNTNDQRELFENSKWVVLEKNEYSRLPKIEAQVWIAIYNLFMEPECRRKYEFNDFKKNNLLRLRKYMNELLLDQIPNLSDMLRSLEELSIMNVASQLNNNSYIIQQLPELRSSIAKDQNWKEIAQYQKDNFFQTDIQSDKEDMRKLAELYGSQVFEGLIDGFKCENCQKNATKRCSKCKLVWYCSRECQVNHWKLHKALCTVAVEKKQTEVSSRQEKSVEVIQDKVEEKVKNVDLNDVD